MKRFKKIVTYVLLATVIIISGDITKVSAASKYQEFVKDSTGKLVHISQIEKQTNYIYRDNSLESEIALKKIEAIRVNNSSITPAFITPYATDPGNGGGGINVGIAWAYTANNRTDVNCYGYAGNFGFALNPGEVKGYKFSSGLPVKTIANYIMYDMQSAGRSARIINQADVIYSNEYRIAIRTGENTKHWDYHVVMQCSDAGWCDKPGQAPSRYLGQINPSTYSWDFKYNNGTVEKNFYNSETIYLAVSKF
ncbi:hypothetical protein NBE98_22235 [Clostridium swellfunianum]|uniref:hypothetical protein n=1 Tax=Clostridium swellfunianum TaxID=1367462 RepID=UPI002030B450|nr:hypothetical protein [Clostridium swellfunianum]MCM0651081.1 hypothetical protein [Clostridium swellfunianum]